MRDSSKIACGLLLVALAAVRLLGQVAVRRANVTVPGAPNCPIFPADNVWNEDISALPVAANSAQIINAIGAGTGLHPDFGSFAGFGIPYNIASSATPKTGVQFQFASESDPGPYPIPASYLIEGNDVAACNAGTGGDCHVLIVDKDACKLYELYSLQKVSGKFQAGSGAIWYLWSNALRPDTFTSADAAGLPILPGLVRFDEVASGVIDHAFRFTVQHTRNAHIYPARHDAGSSNNLPPMGLRVRLRASIDISGFTPQAKVVLAALKKYGMILADNGSNWFISGASDPNFNDDDLHNLGQIKGSDLEVVDTSGFVNGPDPDFSLTLANAVAGPVFPGVMTAFSGNLSAIGGYNASVAITCGAGAPASCAPSPTNAIPDAGFSVNAAGAAAQDYVFPIRGTGGDPAALTHSQTATLHVVDFSISAPASVTVLQGNPSAAQSVSVVPVNGFAGDVNLSCSSGMPAGASCQFSPAGVSAGASGTLVVASGTAAAGGPTAVTLSGTTAGAPAARTTTFNLTIQPAGADGANMTAGLTHSISASGASGAAAVGSTVVFHAVLTDSSSTKGVTGELLVTFSETVSAGALPAGCSSASGASILCTAALASGGAQQFDLPVQVGFSHSLTVSAFASSNLAETAPGDNVHNDTVQVRPRPFTVK